MKKLILLFALSLLVFVGCEQNEFTQIETTEIIEADYTDSEIQEMISVGGVESRQFSINRFCYVWKDLENNPITQYTFEGETYTGLSITSFADFADYLTANHPSVFKVYNGGGECKIVNEVPICLWTLNVVSNDGNLESFSTAIDENVTNGGCAYCDYLIYASQI